MTLIKTQYNRRSFLKVSAAAGGGMIIGFNWLTGCTPASAPEEQLAIPNEWFDINGYVKIGDTGLVTIYSPNPEIGQNIKTSMPMVVAEELDVDWNNVVVEQAPLNTGFYQNQFAGGSLSLRLSWDALRMAGATGKQMLLLAAAKEWSVSASDLVAEGGIIREKNGERTIGYGELASKAAEIEVPEEVPLKKTKDYKLIGKATKNVDGKKIVTGEPLFGLDYEEEGMKLAVIHHPPAFGTKITGFNADEIKSMPGVTDAFIIDTDTGSERWSSINAFQQLVAIVGESTWQLFKAKKALKVDYEEKSPPENSDMHRDRMISDLEKGQVIEERTDGDVDAAFAKAAKVIERTYTSPFMAHNTMEPMNFFANVTADKAELVGPIQTPEALEAAASALLDLPVENIEVNMTRQGGGFGRRLYGNFGLEAAAISKQAGVPIKLIYTREDDMTQGTYRPPYRSTYKAGLDENNNLIAFQARGVGLPGGSIFPNRFPAGAVDNYQAERLESSTNVTTAAWRAPRSHFTAGAEQAFLDEVAEAAGKDPIDFRLELFDRAKNDPVGGQYDYDADRYAGVLKLAREKANWGQETPGVYRGIAAYFCHYSYVAEVVDIVMEDGQPKIKKVTAAVDCGIVVNPEGAKNQIEGGIIDGIGHSMYSQLTFEDGAPQQQNFDRYNLIRHTQAPEEIEVYFVENEIAPTGLGEPGLPPAVAALTNAMYQATGKRWYHQPFTVAQQEELIELG